MFNRYHLKIDENIKHAEWLFFFVDKTIKEIENNVSNFSSKAIYDLVRILFSQLYIIAADSLDNELFEELDSKGEILFNNLDFVREEQKEESALLVKEELISKGENAFNEKYPLLKEALDSRCRYFKDTILEMNERLKKDINLVSNELLNSICFRKIESLDAPTKDLHNYGRFPLIVTTDKGKFLYKAHSMSTDLWFYNFSNKLFNDVIHVPKVLSIDGEYGYSEFIVNKPANTFEKAKKYYYNIGGFLAILETLGSSDFHFENILSYYEYPIPVDFETIIEIGDQIVLNTKPINKSTYFDLPVIRKGILPLYMYSEKRELSPLLSQEDNNVSMPIVDGKRINIDEYIEDFKEGFKDIYLRCLKNREEIIEELYKLNDSNIRAISIGTQKYMNIMMTLYNHENLTSISKRTAVINNHLCKYSIDKLLNNYTNSVIDGLIKGDIPYHYAKANSRDICYFDKVVLKNYLSDSPINICINNIKNLSLEDLNFELALIDKQFCYSVHNGYNYKKIEVNDAIIHFDVNLLKSELENIYDSIKKSYVMDSKGNQNWIIQDDNLETRIMDESLFQGLSGLAIFFTSYIQTSSDTRKKAEAFYYLDVYMNKLFLSLDYYKDLLKKSIYSLGLSGLAGILLTSIIVLKELNRDKDKKLLEKVVELLECVDINKYNDVDVYNGLSGLLIVLSKNIDMFDYNYTIQIIKKLADRIIKLRSLEYKEYLLWDTLGKNRPISGWGHGTMGVVEALDLAYEITDNKEYLKVAIESYKFEHNIYSEKLNTWPDFRELPFAYDYMHGLCSGAPGIGNALLSIRKEKSYYETYDIDLSRVENACFNITNYRDHLCCGNSSILDFLINAYNLTNRKEYLDNAYNLLLQMVKRKEDINDYVLLPSDFKTNNNPTLFFGLSGIGLEISKLIKAIEHAKTK